MTRAPFAGPLVSAQWLSEHLDDVRVIDTRWYLDGRSGRAAYRRGHIPGAVWLDVDSDLSAPASARDGRHPLPTPEAFAATLGRIGIAPGTAVVAYDDAGGSIAARLWWMLHVLDEPVAVLDGGLAAWPGPLTTVQARPTPVRRPVRAWPAGRFVTADELAGSGAVVLDARTRARYEYGDPAIDPRPGHIPGARSMPWGGNLDEDAGTFLSVASLRHRYGLDEDDTGDAEPSQRLVAYCGSGVTACHNLLALTVAGHDDVALYAGSWSQWGSDPARPGETGAGSQPTRTGEFRAPTRDT